MFSLTRAAGRSTHRILRRCVPTTYSWRRSYTQPSPPPPELAEGERAIYEKLQARFSPSQLQVQDISGGCGAFYAISIASSQFKGLPMVKQHRLVTEELKKEIAGIHGLQINTKAE